MLNNEKKILKAFDSNTNKEVISRNNGSNSFDSFMFNIHQASTFHNRIKTYFEESKEAFFYEPAGNKIEEVDIYNHNRKKPISSDFINESKYVVIFKRLLEVPPVMVDFLRMFGYEDSSAYDYDLVGWSHWSCPTHGDFYFPNMLFGSLNPYRKLLTAKKNVSRIMNALDILSDLESFYVNFLTLTTPEEVDSYVIAHSINPNDFMRDAMKEFRREFERKFSFKLNGEFNLHFWSTKKPLESHFHVHLFFLNINIDKDGRITKLSETELFNGLEKLRACWFNALVKTLKKYMIPLNIEIYRDVINIHAEYLQYTKDNLGGILHKLTYARRSYLMDLADYFWEHPIPEDYSPVFISNSLLYGIPNRTHRIGFFARLQRRIEKAITCSVLLNDFEKDVAFQQFADRRQRCPICGKKMFYVGKEDPHMPAVGSFILSEYRNRLFYVRNRTFGGG